MGLFMKELDIKIRVEVYETAEELSKADQLLLEKANEAVERAYAPYSDFNVGAALLLNNGEIVLGSNQENAAYPLALCAERVAIFAAATSYPDQAIESIAIRVKNRNKVLEEPVSPCGSCRQVMLESEFRHKQAMRILLQGEKGSIYLLKSVKDLLPLLFNADFL